MKTIANNVSCPNCNHSFDVSEILTSRLKKNLEEELNVKLKNEKKIIEVKLKNELQNEFSEEIKSYQEQLLAKTNEVIELNKLRSEFQKLQREKIEMKEKLEAEMQFKLTTQINEARSQIREQIEQNLTMKISEKDILIGQMKFQIQELSRKAEQTSVQLQGEAQEIAIEEFLMENFPKDQIEPIKKGIRGADCLQIVINDVEEICGSIYYESKRTKEFKKEWIDKFKADMLEKKATFGVIITNNYPKDFDRLCQIKGIWICSWNEFQSLCLVLRNSLLMFHQIQIAQENKGGKMEMLYQYLIGSEFRGHIEAIVDSFIQMQDDLNKERRAFEGQWKQREKQISKVLLNTSQLFSSIKGIAGNSVQSIKALEMPKGSSSLN